MNYAEIKLLPVVALIFASALPRAASGEVDCRSDEQGWCTDKVLRLKVSSAAPDVSVNIKSALSIGTTIEWPARAQLAEAPTLANENLFEFKRGEEDPQGGSSTRTLELIPRIAMDASNTERDDFEGSLGSESLVSRIRFSFAIGITVSVRVRVVEPLDKQVVERLVIEVPELESSEAWAQRRVKELLEPQQAELRQLRQDFDLEARKQGYRQFFTERMKLYDCRSLYLDQGASQLAVVHVPQICKVGTYLAVDFLLVNRRKQSVFAIGNVQVRSKKKPLSSEYVLEGGAVTKHLRFDDRIKGTIWWPATKDTEFTLEVLEEGGLGRRVVVNGITF